MAAYCLCKPANITVLYCITEFKLIPTHKRKQVSEASSKKPMAIDPASITRVGDDATQAKPKQRATKQNGTLNSLRSARAISAASFSTTDHSLFFSQLG